ncbi:MAG: hypothetical protein EBQ87_06785 [Planctomycetes bacterium]|nr:hypothetical protein [Planctomycetota bacterium]
MPLNLENKPALNKLNFLGLSIAGAILFCFAYSQAPLYYSNQNQYFLHGFSKARVGYLEKDWLGNTTDPTPLFSELVCFSISWINEYIFYLYYAILQGIFLFCAWIIYQRKSKTYNLEISHYAFFSAIFILLNSAALRWLSYRLLGQDYPWFLQAGVAGQYILGAMFQPSNFGVFLLLGLSLFLIGKHVSATVFTCLAGILHTTYLLSGAFIIIGFQLYLVLDGRIKKAMLIGILALLLVMPSVFYAAGNFQPSTTEGFKEAQEFLVKFRLPHHCLPSLWLDWVAWLQIIWIILSILLLRKQKEFTILLVPFLLGTLLTILQVLTQNNTLALLFPWRISSVLVPLATMLILSESMVLFIRYFPKFNPFFPSVVTIVLLAFLGIAIPVLKIGFVINENENSLLAHIKNHKAKDDLYMIPVNIPNLAATTRGSLSSDFKPLRKKTTDTRIVPIDMQRFRLYAQAPLYVDFKAIPYKDADVLDWHKRLLRAQDWQKRLLDSETPKLIKELREEHITHIVTNAKVEMEQSELELKFSDEHFKLWKIKEAREP